MADITKDALDTIISLATPTQFTIGDLPYSSKPLNIIAPPVPAFLKVKTLNGLVDLIETGFEYFNPNEVLIHVTSHEEVDLIQKSSDGFARRQVWVEATVLKADKSFKFNEYYPVEEFIIATSSLFVDTPQLRDLIVLAGNITASADAQVIDDGVSQKVAVRAGVSFVESTVLKSRWELAPYRTFREISQPASDFIFRVKTSPTISCALYEADGGIWKLEAINGIQLWLKNQLIGSEVLTVNNIPIIA